MASAGRRGSLSKEKQKMAAEARRSSISEQNALETVHSADGSESSPLTAMQRAGRKAGALGTVAKTLDPFGNVVRPGVVDCEAIMEYFMHGPPRKGEEEHFHRHAGEGSLKETVERVMYAVFDDRFFLHDAFKSLDGDSTGLLTEDELGHWVHCLSTCSPVHQQTTEPAERCKSCMDKGFTPYRCKCVPRALPKTEKDPDVGRAADWKELGPLGTKDKDRVGWASEAVAETTLKEQMKNIIEDILQKRAPIAPELLAGAAPCYFDWHDFLVVTMDFYVALGIRSMHAIFAVLLGNDCEVTGPALPPKAAKAETDADATAAGDEDGESTRPAAKAAFEGQPSDGVQQIGTQSGGGGGGLFGCCRPRKEAVPVTTATPAPGAASS